MPRSVQYVYRSQNLLKLNMQCQRTIPKENTKNKPPSLTFSKIPKTWSFHVVVFQRTAKKCTRNYNARAQLLFCSLNLLFCGALVAVAVVVCLRSLMLKRFPHTQIIPVEELRTVRENSTPTLRTRRHGSSIVDAVDPYWGSLHCVGTLTVPLLAQMNKWVLVMELGRGVQQRQHQ